MASLRTVEWGVVGVVLLTAIASSGAFGVGDGSARNPAVLGDGNASVTVDSLPAERLHVDEGRFGTNVAYFRVPDAVVRVGDVTGTPRLVYRIRVPALGVDEATTHLLATDRRGTVRLHGVDRAFDPATITEKRYEATVTVRVQSFERDRTVLSANETVEVER